jgi:hypothetical protein
MLLMYMAQHQGHGMLKVKKYTFCGRGFSCPSDCLVEESWAKDMFLPKLFLFFHLITSILLLNGVHVLLFLV